MNQATAISLYATGTSEGVCKGHVTQGHKTGAVCGGGESIRVLTEAHKQQLVSDVLKVFPEATGIELGGSVARGAPDRSKIGDSIKKSDIDIIIRLPKHDFGYRLDDLFKKYRGGLGGRVVDFIATYPGGNYVGQHLFRWERGLLTPTQLLWGKMFDETADRERYLKRIAELKH